MCATSHGAREVLVSILGVVWKESEAQTVWVCIALRKVHRNNNKDRVTIVPAGGSKASRSGKKGDEKKRRQKNKNTDG